MDDLDALLADLQTTTKNMTNQQNQATLSQQTHHYATPSRSPNSLQSSKLEDMVEGRGQSESPPPPPLPPPPSQDILDSLNDPDSQPLYELQQISVARPAVLPPSGDIHVTMTAGYQSLESPNYHQISPTTPTNHQKTSPSSPYKVKKTPPPIAAKPVQSPPPTSPQQQPIAGMSLSNNLSELDVLLQDLNSAQFMAEVDRRNSANSTMSYPLSPGPPASTPVHTPIINRSEFEEPGYSTIEERGILAQFPVEDTGQDRGILAQFPVEDTGHYNVVNSSHSHSHTGPVASSATKELDDLMASLSNFKVNVDAGGHNVTVVPGGGHNVRVVPGGAGGGDSAYAQPNKPAHSQQFQAAAQPQPQPQPQQGGGSSSGKGQTQLDTMLGNLQSDMSKQGVTTREKGQCAACDKPIVGQVITALGKIWHPEHFTCTECQNELGTKNFFERDGKPFCERDYHNLFSPKCAYCNGPILDKCVTALGNTWHAEHFFCAQCGRTFDDEGFHEKDGKAFCREDYFEMFAPKCGGCNRPIMDNYISALLKQWHAECFVCRDCGISFGGGSFFDHEGLPYCETHYHAKRGSLCAGCQKPITGRCITAMYKKFHPEHFVCAFCLKQLNKGTFKEQNDKPYCHSCFVKLFG